MDKAQMMFLLIDEYNSSGLSMRDFTAGKGIKLSTFTYWIRKKKRLEARSATGNFIPLNCKNPESSVEAIDIVYPNGVRIVTSHFNLQQIHQLVKLY